VVTPTETWAERSAILSFTATSQEMNQRLFERLAADGIVISLRGGRCRVSPSFFNTEQEIDRFLEAVTRA
jgi:selenocysteine lyase/cysteine desulfurase